MSYIDNNLMNGESVVYCTKLHWAIFLRPITLFVIAIMISSSGSDAAALGILLILVAIVLGVFSFINFKTAEFGITNKRVIVKVGFIRINSIEVLLNKVEGIQVHQGVIGRILGFGSITISGTGGTKDPFHKIDTPFKFRKKAQEQIEIVQNS